MDQAEIQEGAMAFIAKNNTMIVATASTDGIPQAATVNFLIDENFNLYFATGKETRKSKNLQTNKKIAFVIGAGPTVITIQGGGQVEEIEGTDLHLLGLIGKELFEKSNKDWPVLKLGHSGVSYYKIKPEWLVWLSMDKENYPDSYYRDYHKVI